MLQGIPLIVGVSPLFKSMFLEVVNQEVRFDNIPTVQNRIFGLAPGSRDNLSFMRALCLGFPEKASAGHKVRNWDIYIDLNRVRGTLMWTATDGLDSSRAKVTTPGGQLRYYVIQFKCRWQIKIDESFHLGLYSCGLDEPCL